MRRLRQWHHWWAMMAVSGAATGLGACAPGGETEFTTGSAEVALLATNGLPSNGLPSNGLPSNGLPSNGLPSNGLPSNGLPSNGLRPGALTTTNFGNWFHWFQGCTSTDGCTATASDGSTGVGTASSRAAAATIMKYIVECACASTETITYTDRAGTNYSWTGVLDLAPTWCNPAATTNIAATTAEQEWVSACLLTVINRRGGDVGGLQISVATANSERPKLAVSGSGSTQGEYFTYLSGYSAPFITYPPSVQYYGNIFGDSTGQKGRYVAPMAEGVAGPHLDWPELGRDCSIDGCGAMTVPGFSSKNMAFATPDIHGHTMPQKANICSWAVGNANIATSCLDDTGRTWTRVITETNPSVSNLTCVSGSCTNVTSGTADGLGATAIGANYVTLGSTGRTEIQRMVGGGLNQYTTKVVFRTRYRSSAAATLKLSALDCYTYAQEWSLGTFTFPSTGDQWAWMNITITWPTYFDWTTTTNPVHIVWSGADTSSPNAKLDASLIALP